MTKMLPLDAIKIEQRAREQMGDVQALADSIASVGLLHPVAVTTDNVLIAGARRIEAMRLLGRDRVAVTVCESVSDALAILNAERVENTCRKDFTPSEAVALGLQLEERLRAEAAERRAKGHERRGKSDLPTNDGKVQRKLRRYQETDPQVAAAIGIGSESTYRRAKAVVRALDDPDPEVRAVAIEATKAMDATGKVTGSFEKVSAAKVARVTPKQRNGKALPKLRVSLAVSRMAEQLEALRHIAEMIGDVSEVSAEDRARFTKALTSTWPSLRRLNQQLKG